MRYAIDAVVNYILKFYICHCLLSIPFNVKVQLCFHVLYFNIRYCITFPIHLQYLFRYNVNRSQHSANATYIVTQYIDLTIHVYS